MSKKIDYMLTTTDNPYDPFTQWEDWYKFDMLSGHDCCGLLDLKALTSPNFGDEKNQQIIYDAIDEIVKNEPKIYKKVSNQNNNSMPVDYLIKEGEGGPK